MQGRRLNNLANKPLTTKGTKEHNEKEGRGPLARLAVFSFLSQCSAPSWQKAQQITEIEMIYGGSQQSDKNKEMIHRFPCQDACASNRWISCSLPGTAATYIRSSISEKVAGGLRNCGTLGQLKRWKIQIFVAVTPPI
jgi:hypothetical protein